MKIDKKFFEKYQKLLLWIINIPIGRLLFGVEKMGHRAKGKKIERLTPNSIRTVKNSRQLFKDLLEIEYEEQFFVRPEYALKVARWVSFLAPFTTTIPSLVHPGYEWTMAFALSTLEVNPATGANSPCDGYVAVTSMNDTFSAVRNAAGNGAGTNETQGTMGYIAATATTNKFSEIDRWIYNFDVSSIGSGPTVNSAIQSYANTATAKKDGLNASPTTNIYNATPAATNTLAASDYGQCGTAAYCDTPITFANWPTTAGVYSDFSHNAAGIAAIAAKQASGIYSSCVRNANYDVANVAPNWVSAQDSYMTQYASDFGSSKPKLVVTYTALATSIESDVIFFN